MDGIMEEEVQAEKTEENKQEEVKEETEEAQCKEETRTESEKVTKTVSQEWIGIFVFSCCYCTVITTQFYGD